MFQRSFLDKCRRRTVKPGSVAKTARIIVRNAYPSITEMQHTPVTIHEYNLVPFVIGYIRFIQS